MEVSSGKITVWEMVMVHGFIICMGIDPRHLGVYGGYFKPTWYVRVGRVYNVKLVGYGGWEERIMNLAHFCQIRSDFRPEAVKSAVGDK